MTTKKTKAKVSSVNTQEAAKQATVDVLIDNTSKYAYLTNNQLQALSEVTVDAVDVTSLLLAKALRTIEKDQEEMGHNLIVIGKVVGKYGLYESLPYFSVKRGTDGWEL
jgi:hypothetical protein